MGRNITLVILLCMGLFFGVLPVWAQNGSNCVEGNGEQASEERNLSTWNKLNIGGAFEVEIEAGGNEESLQLSGESNILPYIKTAVADDGVLRIYVNHSVCLNQPLKIRIHTPQLLQLSTNGSNNIRLHGLEQETFELKMVGADAVELEGKVNEFRIDTEGTALLDSTRLQAQQVYIVARGTSSAQIYAARSLNAHAAGLAQVIYMGNPQDLKRRVSALGSVQAAE